MFYIQELLGMRYASPLYDSQLKVAEGRLRKEGVIREEATLKPVIGEINQLKSMAKEFDEAKYLEQHLEGLERVYEDEKILMIFDSDKNLISIMRAWKHRDESSRDEKPSDDIHTIMPRYDGFSEDRNLFSQELMRYLAITLERFVVQEEFYFEKAKTTAAPKSNATKGYLIDILKEKFFETSGKEFLKDRKMESKFNSAVTELMTLILLRARSDSKITPKQLIDFSFIPYNDTDKNLPKELNDPNQLLEIAIRMSVLGILSVIRDGEGLECDDLIKESSRLYTYVTGTSYNRDTTVDRLILKKDRAKAFEGMFKEVFGDLAKVTAVCAVTDPVKRMRFATRQLLENRISKVDKAARDGLDRVCESIQKLRLPKDLKDSMNNLMISAYKHTILSNSNIEAFEEADSEYEKCRYAVEDKIREYKSKAAAATRIIAAESTKGINKILRNLDSIVKSKRNCEVAVKEISKAAKKNTGRH